MFLSCYAQAKEAGEHVNSANEQIIGAIQKAKVIRWALPRLTSCPFDNTNSNSGVEFSYPILCC